MTLEEAIKTMSGPALVEIGRILPYSIENLPHRDEFYQGRIGASDPLTPSDRPLMQALEKLSATAYHEIGGGIGLLPITLGLMGYRSVNIDEAPSRVAHGQKIVDALAIDHPRLLTDVQMIYAKAPDVFGKLDTEGACAFSTNIASSMGWPAASQLLAAIQKQYAAYVFDLCLLFGVFRTPDTWGDCLNRISSLWGRQPELLFASGDYQRYYIVRF